MDKTLLIVERIVIESLNRKSLLFDELCEQTGLDEHLLQAILAELHQRGVLTYHKGRYELNWEMKKCWLPLVHDKEGKKAEIKELFAALVNQIYAENRGSLKVQKIYLNQRERDELQRKLQDIDSFITSVKNQRKVHPVREITAQQEVLFYGFSSYECLMSDILKVG